MLSYSPCVRLLWSFSSRCRHVGRSRRDVASCGGGRASLCRRRDVALRGGGHVVVVVWRRVVWRRSCFEASCGVGVVVLV